MLEQLWSEVFRNIPVIFWVALLFCIPLFLLKAFLKNPKVKGRIGEKLVRSTLLDGLDKEIYFGFHDLIIPSRNGTTQIDHVYVSAFGIFVLESKNYTGWIFGNEKQAGWTQIVYRKKHYFQNPLRQNYAHIKALSALLGLPENKFHSLVVFLGDCELKTEMPPNVLRAGQAASYIKGFQTTLLTQQEIETVIAVLSSDSYQADSGKTKAHIEHLRQRH